MKKELNEGNEEDTAVVDLSLKLQDTDLHKQET